MAVLRLENFIDFVISSKILINVQVDSTNKGNANNYRFANSFQISSKTLSQLNVGSVSFSRRVFVLLHFVAN